MKLIVGLGNPGKEYEKTRHNIGFMCVDNFVDNSKWSEKFSGLLTEISYNGEKIIFLKPMTYMNESGYAVKKVMDYYNLDISDILIIFDDMDLEIGKLKIKVNSSSGGHNGIKSIISHLKTESFARVKIGISHNRNIDTKNYVLGKFSKAEMDILNPIIKKTKDIIESFVNNGIEKTMNIYNTK